MTIDGGAVAAYGFRRQYLVAAEEILRIVNERVDDLGGLTLVIEPTRADLGTASDADDDIVDFAIEVGGTVVRRVQVKSSKTPSGMNPLRYSDASSIFRRMGTNAGEAVILTNKPLAKKLVQACGPPIRRYDEAGASRTCERGLPTGWSWPVEPQDVGGPSEELSYERWIGCARTIGARVWSGW